MVKKLFEMKPLGMAKSQEQISAVPVQTYSPKDIAIIGIGGQIGSAAGLNEFWKQLRSGTDAISDFPEERKKTLESFFLKRGVPKEQLSDLEFFQGAFLPEIDAFDYELFSIPPSEAAMMDPCQRIWLETVWTALEDAGYGGDRIKGTNTGVFVGHSDDFGVDYKDIIHAVNPAAAEYSGVGNIKSTIPGRISYLLDLKGPSLIVDTACSSALVAIHLACRSLRNRECDMALAGGVKLQFMPIKPNNPYDIGLRLVGNIGAADGRARTFDDDSDGTGMGEGAAAVLLKPLHLAVQDQDHIYAVIKGSAMNQDGASIGITAPNSEAQEQVIIEAWTNAGVNPETVSYIEAHGTGTPLGDPVEINGIERAFRKYTDRKQFCAVGSVKTNVGHLDNASGMAGLLKVVAALKHQELPPTVHFQRPNQKIDFLNSPVYVVDKLSPWVSDGEPRHCGISAFGLSGTNCHLVLEEAPKLITSEREPQSGQHHLFALSAKSREALSDLVVRYHEFLNLESEHCDLGDLCFTVHTGREHYTHRLAIVISSLDELSRKIALLAGSTLKSMPEQAIYYGEHKVVSSYKQHKDPKDLTEEQKREISRKAQVIVARGEDSREQNTILELLCHLYIDGAEVAWEHLYAMRSYRRISLPTYPFRKTKCWIQTPQDEAAEVKATRQNKGNVGHRHPLLHTWLTDSNLAGVFQTTFDVQSQWVLEEHKIMGNYVVPGTTYLEMIREACSSYYQGKSIDLEDVTFLSPLILGENDTAEIYTILTKQNDYMEFNITSSSPDGEWSIHAEGKVRSGNSTMPQGRIDIDEIMNSWKAASPTEFTTAFIEIGPRWGSIVQTYHKEHEALLHLKLPEVFQSDLLNYYIHPAMMDCAMNGINPHAEGEFYLPYQYKKISIFGPTPSTFYSYLDKHILTSNNETATFSVKLVDEQGIPFAIIKDYTVKRVRQPIKPQEHQKQGFLHEIGWKTQASLTPVEEETDFGSMLIFRGNSGNGDRWVDFWKSQGRNVIEVERGPSYQRIHECRYIVSDCEEDYVQLLTAIAKDEVSTIIHMGSLTDTVSFTLKEEIDRRLSMGVQSFFYLVKAINASKVLISSKPSIIVISNNVNGISGEEKFLNPLGKALFGVVKVAGEELSAIRCRALDLELETDAALVAREVAATDGIAEIAYRSTVRYQEELRLANSEIKSDSFSYKESGVYLITGGTGGIGLEVAHDLSSVRDVKLCLIHRSPLPPMDQWEEMLETTPNKLRKTIESLLKLKESGVELRLYQVDVTDFMALKEVLGQIRSEFGSIHGIFHGAGVAGDGFLFRKEYQTFQNVISPKIHGTWNLDQLTREDSLDFFILFSSVSSFVATAGQGDYTAANAFLDTYADYRTSCGRRTLSINWAPWIETGMAHEYQVDLKNFLFKGLRTADALKQMKQAMSSGKSRLIIAEINPEADISIGTFPPMSDELALLFDSVKKLAEGDLITTNDEQYVQSGLMLLGKSESDLTDTEKGTGTIWANILGLGKIDIYDNFYQLGGDSIVAIRLLKALDASYPDVLDITDIFTYSSVYELAAYIDLKKGVKPQNHSDKNSKMTVSDILELLANGEIAATTADEWLMQLEEDNE